MTKLAQWIKSLFEYKSDLERYILSGQPAHIGDVENLARQFYFNKTRGIV